MADTNTNDLTDNDHTVNDSTVNNSHGSNSNANSNVNATTTGSIVANATTQQLPLNPGLYAPDPAAPPPVNLTLFEIVGRLMNPPAEYRDDNGNVTLWITWVVGVAGVERFEQSPLGHRHSLLQSDDLYVHGEVAGLSKEILQWLRYGEDSLVLPASHFSN